MSKLILLLEQFINKYHIKYFEENPYEEFLMFIGRLKKEGIFYKIDDPINKLIEMIDSRIISREKLEKTYNNYYSFDNKIKGVRLLVEIYNMIRDISNLEIEKADENKLYYLMFLLEMILSSSYPIIRFNNVDDYIELIELYNKSSNQDMKQYFRGQSNSKWNLIPSCLRNIDQTKTFVYDYDKLIEQYKSISVYDLYRELINKDPDDYEMISFFQHAISFSPLIDFTTNIIIATYFALGNYNNINDFFNNDSCVIAMSDVSGDFGIIDLKDDDFKKMKVGVYKKGLKNHHDYYKMFRKMGRLHGSDAITRVSSNRLNDRMKYQSGVFIFFNKYILDKPESNVIFNKYSQQSIVKLVIDKSIKAELLKKLLALYPNYNTKYLMNPYSRFEEL